MLQQLGCEKKLQDLEEYQRTQMQREIIIARLKERGCRITKQRLLLLDIILNGECSCCKEIYYKATQLNKGIGSATVYRMVNVLEEIGAISRKNMYRIACGRECSVQNACIIEFDNDMVIELSAKEWNQVIRSGLIAAGYMDTQNIRSVIAASCEYAE